MGLPNFDGTDAGWESWRVKFQAYADLADIGAHLEVAAEQTSFIKHEGLDAHILLVSRAVYALLITKCEGKPLSLVCLVPRRFGLEAWRVLKDEYQEKGGNRMAARVRGILNPLFRWEKTYSEGRDLGDMHASWGKDVAQHRIAAGADLQQAVQVATAMERSPAADRDLLKVVPLATCETYQTFRAYVREWTLAQRTYDDLGRHTTSDTSAPMDIGQVKGTKGKGNKGKKGKGKEKGKSKKENGEAEGNAWTIPILLASVCIVASGVTRRASAGSRSRTKEANSQLQQFQQLQQ